MKGKKNKTIEAEIEINDWQTKLNQHRNSILITVIVVLFTIIASSIMLHSLKKNSQNSWRILGTVLNTTENAETLSANFYQKKGNLNGKIPNITFRDEVFDADFQIKDLNEKAASFLRKVLIDTKGLPKGALPEEEKGIEMEASLDQVKIRFLPSALTRKAILLHNIEELEKQLANAENTTAAPWLYHYLAYLNSWEFPAKALQYYQIMTNQYADHLQQVSNVLPDNFPEVSLQEDVNWQKNYKRDLPVSTENEQGIALNMITSRGIVKILIYSEKFPIATAHFSSMVKKGFFNGLNFYQSNDNSIRSGCPLGNGKGGVETTLTVNAEATWLRRGSIVMDNYDKAGKIGSRFILIRKFTVFDQAHAIIGHVTEGMDIVDQLTTDDILLDVSIEK